VHRPTAPERAGAAATEDGRSMQLAPSRRPVVSTTDAYARRGSRVKGPRASAETVYAKESTLSDVERRNPRRFLVAADREM